MEKIKKLIPDKIPIAGHRVIVSEKVLNNMVERINNQTIAINAIIDCIETIDKALQDNSTELETIKESVKTLASALKSYMEE